MLAVGCLKLIGAVSDVVPGVCSCFPCLGSQVFVDFVTLRKLFPDAVLDSSSKLGIVLGQGVLLILNVNEYPVDIFSHILTSQSLVLAIII